MFQTIITSLNNWKLSTQATSIILASLSESTKGQYNSHLSRFHEFCKSKQHFNLTSVPVNLGIEYLTDMFNSGLSYSSINTARSAISQFVMMDNSMLNFGEHPLTVKFMKGVFKLRPPTPKYDTTWDVAPVLTHLKGLDVSNLKNLTFKCVMLLALTTGQRVQTLSVLDLEYLTRTTDKFVFAVRDIIKTSKPNKHHQVVIVKYDKCPQICPYVILVQYLERTSALRQDNKLFVSIQKPHKPVSAQTISRWLVQVLRTAGVSTSFGAHSTRHASSSMAHSREVSMDTILKTVGWAREKTFASFYRKNIESDQGSFSRAVLDNIHY